jgi:hypothetical protein
MMRSFIIWLQICQSITFVPKIRLDKKGGTESTSVVSETKQRFPQEITASACVVSETKLYSTGNHIIKAHDRANMAKYRAN